uniref:Ig-like domain-containing protein n=1 Tax=Electrophorus electricus TaxID=8005 RepID=A0A4W4E255_ELEEL
LVSSSILGLCFFLDIPICKIATQKIYPLETVKHVSEGDSVNLSCNYSGSSNILQWYRQYPTSRPNFIVLISQHDTKKESDLPGVSARVDKDQSRVDLLISSAAVSDSALYYCALQPTVTGNPATLYKNLLLHR